MDEDKLKLLAEWYGFEIQEYSKDSVDWQPDKDSNQLDMLKKKFIKELRLKYYPSLLKIKIIVARNGVYCLDIFVEQSKGWLRLPELEEAGKENECWLNAILNYVEQKL